MKPQLHIRFLYDLGDSTLNALVYRVAVVELQKLRQILRAYGAAPEVETGFSVALMAAEQVQIVAVELVAHDLPNMIMTIADLRAAVQCQINNELFYLEERRKKRSLAGQAGALARWALSRVPDDAT